MSNKKEKLTCLECTKSKDKDSGFYNSNSDLYKTLGKIPICKTCLRSKVDYNNMDSIYNILKQFDIMFDIEYWQRAEKSKTDTFARYITMANSLPQFEGRGWENSVFVAVDENDKSENFNDFYPKSDFKATNEIVSKWGFGYTQEEYKAFEQKYSLLKNNYQEKTAMHTEALLTYIRYRVKEEIATAKGDSKSAKEWGTLAKDAATAAKINPSQLSKSDLSDGLDTFGQLVRSVEQAVDIIPILPVFKERPQDKVDFTIWCYINYIRDLKGLPLAEYEDIYRFYDERKKEYEDRNES